MNINKKLKEIVRTHPGGRLPYVTLRAAVKPLGNPIISNNNPNVTGVIQSLRIREHVVQRSSTGFWADSHRTIQKVYNVMPFALEAKGYLVEVSDPLVADYLGKKILWF